MTNKLPTATTAAATLGVLTILGCSAATATATAAAKPSTPITAAHLTAFAADDGPTQQVVLTGAVGDYGQGVSVNPDGSVNPEHNSQLELRLQHGTFRLDIAGIDKAFVSAMAHEFPTDRATCSGHVEVTQRVPVVKDSGTGAYRGVSGDFTLTVSLDEVDKPAAGRTCDGTQTFLSQALITVGPGNLRF